MGNSCKSFVRNRHDSVLKYLFFLMLVKFGFISKLPFWYCPEKVKLFYQNENCAIYWNIEEYRIIDEEREDSILPPGGEVIMIAEKKIYLF